MARIVIDFRDMSQAKAFIEWFRDYGFYEFQQNDSVHDDLPSKFMPKKLKDCDIVRENVHYDGIIKII